MKKAILFNFLVDKENKQIKVERSFDASLPLVWQAWTDAAILDQWWAPQPYQNRTKTMDFREGGRWHYCMISPEGETHWCVMDYKTIHSKKNFTAIDAFATEAGEINTSFPHNNWDVSFAGHTDDSDTVVNVIMTFDKLEDLEQIVQMGFKEGFTAGLNQLEEWLNKQVAKS